MSPERLLRQHHETLGRLSRSVAVQRGDERAAWAEIVEAAAVGVDVDRVGIWLYSEDRSRIVCALQLVRGAPLSSGAEVRRADVPAYFEAMESSRILAVDDVRSAPSMAELLDGYLIPLGVASLLDVPIMLEGRVIGVVCHEHVGEPRPWSAEAQMFAASIADFVALARAVAERRRTAEELRDREALLSVALDASRAGTWSWDVERDVVTWSDSLGPLVGEPKGWSPPHIASYLELVLPEDREILEQAVRDALAGEGRGDYAIAHRFVRRDGEVRWMQCSGRVVDGESGRVLLGLCADVTGARATEQRLHQAQRLEGLGRLAGGVAHDLNNLLTAMSGWASVLQRQLDAPNDPAVAAALEGIGEATARAAGLTGQLLAFARRQPAAPKRVDIRQPIAAAERLLARMAGDGVKLQLHPWPTPLEVRIDETQLEQVLVNLVVNASQAMPAGGLIELRLDEVEDREGPNEPLRSYARLIVDDTGPGLAEGVVEHVFEPFFTTRGDGGGTGLGLATCYGVAKQAGGFARASNRRDHGAEGGARFELLLPTVGRSSTDLPRIVPPPPEPKREAAARVALVVENEAVVRRFLSVALGRGGWTVHTAEDGATGARMAAELAWELDVLITDLRLPGVDGPDVMAAGRRVRPSLPVLMISGLPPDAGWPVHADRRTRFLGKPFGVQALLQAVDALTTP